MEEIIKKIIKQNRSLFGENPIYEKIHIGFTNTIYKVNDSFIVKICTEETNEESFIREINFYNKNKESPLIPKLYYSNTDKKYIPYSYEIIEKIDGESLYSIWHTLKENEREKIIKQLCIAMKEIHKNKGNNFDWVSKIKEEFNVLYKKAKNLNLLGIEEEQLLNQAYSNFDKYLQKEEIVLVHNDLHFDNIFYKNGKITLIDFERSIYAPKDFELDILYRMIRMPKKFASEEQEKYVNIHDYQNIMSYIEKYYKELISTPNLYQKLAIYDIIYFLNQLIEHKELEELKANIISSAKIVIKNDII